LSCHGFVEVLFDAESFDEFVDCVADDDADGVADEDYYDGGEYGGSPTMLENVSTML
jgi:hypothetical protein